MALRNIRIGSLGDIHTYDDNPPLPGVPVASAIETDAPISAGVPIAGSDVLRLDDLADIFLDLLDSVLTFENEVVCFEGNIIHG